MSEEKITIIIADDHKLVRKSMISLIEDDPAFKVIGEANNGKELLDLLQAHKPHLVLLDLQMPVMNGPEALAIIQQRFPEIKTIIVSMHSELTYIAELISRGARAYVTKDMDEMALWKALYAVHRDGHYFDHNSSTAILKGLQQEKSINMVLNELSLSKREVEILKELVTGKTNKEIADTLNIRMTTVSFHRTNIYRKTKSHNITELVKYSIKNGVVSTN